MSATERVVYPRVFIPQNLIATDLYNRLTAEVENVLDDPNKVDDVAQFIGMVDECTFIAKNDDEFRWGMNAAYNLQNAELIFEPSRYVFIIFGHQDETYYCWVHLDSREVVALHKENCDLLLDEYALVEEFNEVEGVRTYEAWIEQGKSLTYIMEIVATAESASVKGVIMTALEEMDVASSTSQEIADRVNSELVAYDEYVNEHISMEPNSDLLPGYDFAGCRIEVMVNYSSREVTSEDVKMLHYEALGIDRDLAEVLQPLPQPETPHGEG